MVIFRLFFGKIGWEHVEYDIVFRYTHFIICVRRRFGKIKIYISILKKFTISELSEIFIGNGDLW